MNALLGIDAPRVGNPTRIDTAASRALGIRFPIVQGGLARIARAELAAAVSEAGGLGQIAVAGLSEPDALRAEIRKARKLTQRPLGVNFPVGHMKLEYLIDIAVEEDIDVVSFTGGNPKPYIDRVRGSGAVVLVLVSGPEQAKKAEQAGADVLATVGFEGGGHIGRSDLTTLVANPLVVQAVSIPVLAGGGIADGRGLAAALALGADGVEVGTRFIATREACAHPNYKDAVIRAGTDETLVIKRSLGTPGRALANEWTRRIVEMERTHQPKESVLELVRADANERATEAGDMEQSVAWLGQSAALVGEIDGAGEVVHRMVNEAAAAARRLGALLM
jgi:NAD(P)H-dependent flavin oxidoreductase YrpB (nitropropane dioxygenase family)